MIKLAYCTPYLWNSGGIDRVITIKANYLAEKLGYDVTIITSDQQGIEPFFPLSPKVKLVDLGIDYYKHNGKSYNRIIDTIIRAYRVTVKRVQHRIRLKKALQKLSPDITISLSRRELPFLYKIEAGGVKVAERHMSRNNRMYHPAPRILQCLNRYFTNRDDENISHYDKCIVLTEEDKSLWRRNDNMVVIPNPITIKNDGRVAELNVKRIIAVGHLYAEKGYDRLIDAWAIVNNSYPDWQLTIIGRRNDLAETKKIKDAIAGYDLTNVELMGETQNIEREYLNSSMLVMSSRYEGLPLVLIEAMSFGVPCVAFACQCGPRDMITDGKDGILVEEGDIGGLANGMMRLIGDEDERKRMGANAKIKSEQYKLPAIMERWDELFKQLTKKKNER